MKTYQIIPNFSKLIVLSFLVFSFQSCNDAPPKTVSLSQQEVKPAKQKVAYELLKYEDFYTEILSNAKLQARFKTVLNFNGNGIIEDVLVKNGQRVKKGQLLCKLNSLEAEIEYNKAKETYQMSLIDLRDKLLAHGYKLEDSLNIPKAVMLNAKVNSNYNSSQSSLTLAKKKLNDRKIIAPHSGVIANLEAKKHSNSSQYENFCTLIDDSKLEVEFLVLEDEVKNAKVGDLVTAISISTDQSFSGKLVSINPIIDENGLISLKAEFDNNNYNVISGTNVKIYLKKKIGTGFVIPKNLVKEQYNKTAILKYNKGIAEWTYMTVKGENTTSFLIESEHLVKGDTLINSSMAIKDGDECELIK